MYVSITNGLTVNGTSSLAGVSCSSLSSTGAVGGVNGTFSGTLNATGTTTLNGLVNIPNNNVSITNGLTVNGTSSLAGVSCSSLSSTGAVGGVNGTFSGTLNATGASTLGVLTAGTSTLGSTTLGGTLYANGGIYNPSATINTFNGTVNINGQLNIGGYTTIGDFNCGSIFSTSGSITLTSGTISASGVATLSGGCNVSGGALNASSGIIDQRGGGYLSYLRVSLGATGAVYTFGTKGLYMVSISQGYDPANTGNYYVNVMSNVNGGSTITSLVANGANCSCSIVQSTNVMTITTGATGGFLNIHRLFAY